MASENNRRVDSGSDNDERYSYHVDGSTVQKAEAIPQKTHKKKKTTNPAVNRKREKTRMMNAGFVVFIAGASIVAMLMCVKYLALKSQITTQTKKIAATETEISRLKADNDAYYNSVISSVDLNRIKEEAMDKLGMGYPTEHQIYQFDTAGNSYVRQYRKIPDEE